MPRWQAGSVPARHTVDNIIRELRAVAELQTAEMLMTTEKVTMGFDATVQEHIHLNSIYFKIKQRCFVVAIDELPEGLRSSYLSDGG